MDQGKYEGMMPIVSFLNANPIRDHVDGAPYQPGEAVRVVDAIDREVHDVAEFIGEYGVVEYLEYECGSGQHFPDDPMIGVLFRDERREEFWSEEIDVDEQKEVG